MKRSDIVRFLILRTLGNFFFLFAIFGVTATFGPALFFEVQFRVAQARGVRYSIAETPHAIGVPAPSPTEEPTAVSQFAQTLTGEKEQILTPKDTDFGIVIPKIGANEKVFANINAGSESEFLDVLQHGVAHAQGSVFPGMQGNIYLFAHSADNFWDVGRYNAVFYLLKDLLPGDAISVFFEGRRHNYTVDSSLIVDPENVSYLMGSQQAGKEQLILQTCWPPGTTWKRLLVIAKPK